MSRTISLVQVCEEGTDNRAPKMSEVEIFDPDDIGGRVIDDDFCALSRIAETILIGLSREC